MTTNQTTTLNQTTTNQTTTTLTEITHISQITKIVPIIDATIIPIICVFIALQYKFKDHPFMKPRYTWLSIFYTLAVMLYLLTYSIGALIEIHMDNDPTNIPCAVQNTINVLTYIQIYIQALRGFGIMVRNLTQTEMTKNQPGRRKSTVSRFAILRKFFVRRSTTLTSEKFLLKLLLLSMLVFIIPIYSAIVGGLTACASGQTTTNTNTNTNANNNNMQNSDTFPTSKSNFPTAVANSVEVGTVIGVLIAGLLIGIPLLRQWDDYYHIRKELLYMCVTFFLLMATIITINTTPISNKNDVSTLIVTLFLFVFCILSGPYPVVLCRQHDIKKETATYIKDTNTQLAQLTNTMENILTKNEKLKDAFLAFSGTRFSKENPLCFLQIEASFRREHVFTYPLSRDEVSIRIKRGASHSNGKISPKPEFKRLQPPNSPELKKLESKHSNQFNPSLSPSVDTNQLMRDLIAIRDNFIIESTNHPINVDGDTRALAIEAITGGEKLMNSSSTSITHQDITNIHTYLTKVRSELLDLMTTNDYDAFMASKEMEGVKKYFLKHNRGPSLFHKSPRARQLISGVDSMSMVRITP